MISKKKQRIRWLILAIFMIATASLIIGFSLKDGIEYYKSPTQVLSSDISEKIKFRLGGLVEDSSLVKSSGKKISFNITDNQNSIPTSFEGILPDLFAENQGVIASGKYINGVFVADYEVSKLYKKNKKIFYKLKKKLPRFFFKFPIKKKELINAILENSNNIKKISSVIHPEVRKNLLTFSRNNKNRKIVILDIPLYLENKLNKKKDIIIFIQSNKSKVYKKIKERKNFNKLIYKKLKKLQFSTRYKRKKSHYVIKNDFNKNSARKKVRDILNNILR